MKVREVLIGVILSWLLVFCLVVASTAFAEDATITWDAPTLNEDGSELTDLAGYILYHGTEPGVYPDSDDLGLIQGATPSVIYPNLTEATHYFVVTAYDTSGNESDYSNEGLKKTIILPEALIIMVY